MKRFEGLDVSPSTTSICVIDGQGHIVFEGVVTTDPDAIGAVLAPHRPDLVGLEAGADVGVAARGPVATWSRDRTAGDPTRPCCAQGFAHQDRSSGRARHRATPADGLVPTGPREDGFSPRAARSPWRPRHPVPAFARSRQQCARFAAWLRSPSALLRERWSGAVRRLIDTHPVLVAAIDRSWSPADRLSEELDRLVKLVRDEARDDAVCRRLMTVPGVGAVIALSNVAAIDDPARFARLKAVGPALDLTPSRYQSGETNQPGAITKAGDARARVALFEAAHVMMMTRVARWFPLKAWAMRVAARRGAKRAKVALARRLAVIPAPHVGQRHRLSGTIDNDAGYACAPFPLREEPGGDDGRGQAAGHFGAIRTPF